MPRDAKAQAHQCCQREADQPLFKKLPGLTGPGQRGLWMVKRQVPIQQLLEAHGGRVCKGMALEVGPQSPQKLRLAAAGQLLAHALVQGHVAVGQVAEGAVLGPGAAGVLGEVGAGTPAELRMPHAAQAGSSQGVALLGVVPDMVGPLPKLRHLGSEERLLTTRLRPHGPDLLLGSEIRRTARASFARAKGVRGSLGLLVDEGQIVAQAHGK
mmetsp:Transcript_129394/g.307008  ORF Transcript_129394/g.307008 Transcript_129394/m.307008 type:complete len:212 (-) Transcript_129394:48-683(-)